MKTIAIASTNEVNISNMEKKQGPLALLKCKCPRCRSGNMFQNNNPWQLKTTMKMNKECPVCKQPLNIEVGFYYGSSYISYGLTILLSVLSFVIWVVCFGLASDKSLLGWLIANAVLLLALQPYLMRVSRTLWLAFFVRYDKNWKLNPPRKLERTNKDQENNW